MYPPEDKCQVKEKSKYLHIVVNPELHKELRRRALELNITVSKYVIDAVMARIRSERKYD